MKLLGGGTEVVVNVMLGEARVNRDAGDTYNRRVGRVIAKSKLTTVAMKLQSSVITEGRQTFYLELGGLCIDIYAEKKPMPKVVNVYIIAPAGNW